MNLTVKYPVMDGESGIAYTKRLLSHAREAGTFRQCSIGYHWECSDPDGESCNCSCHAVGITLTREQLEAWAGRELDDEEVVALELAIPNSSIPDAVATIAENL